MSEIRGHFLKFTLTGDITPIFTFENEDEQLTGGVREKISEFLNTFQQQFFNETKKELQKMMFGQNNNEIKSVDGMIELLEGQIFKGRETLIEGELSGGAKFKVKILSSFARCKNPFRRFNAAKKGLTIQFSLSKRTNKWFQSPSEQSLLQRAIYIKEQDERKKFLFANLDEDELLKYGHNILRNIECFDLQNEDINETEKPLRFPIWAEKRIREISSLHPIIEEDIFERIEKEHSTVWLNYLDEEYQNCEYPKTCPKCVWREKNFNKTFCPHYKDCKECFLYYQYKIFGHCGTSNCNLCHEYNCYITLRWWYNEIFLKREEKPTIVLADGPEIKGIKRLKGLVVLGGRETGKTKFFESLVKPETRHKRIIHVKKHFS